MPNESYRQARPRDLLIYELESKAVTAFARQTMIDSAGADWFGKNRRDYLEIFPSAAPRELRALLAITGFAAPLDLILQSDTGDAI